MENWSKEFDETVTNYINPEDEDYEMPDTANDGDTTEQQEVYSTVQGNLVKQLVQDKIFHKREDELISAFIRQLQE